MHRLSAADLHEAGEAAGFPRVSCVWVKWADGPRLREDPGAKGLLVDRGEFDLRLLERARSLGVRVHQPARILEQIWDGAKWHLTIDADGTSKSLDADFVADARGRRNASPNRQTKTGPSTLAVYGYWRGASLPATPRIEAGEDGWYWGVPLPDATYNTLVFVDPDWFRSAPGSTMSERFLGLISRSSLMEDCRDVELTDPLLRRPESTDAALSFYRSQLTDASERHRRWAAAHYRDVADTCDRPFWGDRAAPVTATESPQLAAVDLSALARTPMELSAELEFVRTPCLHGDFVSLASALHHPRLAAPLVFLGGRELAPLLQRLPSGKTPLEIAEHWSNRMPLESGMAIAGWLVKHGLFVGQSHKRRTPP